MSMDLLATRFANVVDNLPTNHRQLAKYYLSNLDEVAFMSASSLAAAVGLSEATVVRFAQRLGFTGYQELKAATQEHLRRRLSSSSSLERALSPQTHAGSALHEMLEEEIEHLTESANRIPHQRFTCAVDLIATAKTIYLFGEGSAGTAVHELQFWLQRLRPHVIGIDKEGRNLFDKVLYVDKDDLLVVFAFRRNNPMVEALQDLFNKNHAQSLLITDLPGSRMALKASLVLDIVRGPIGRYRSMAVPVAVADALVLGMVRKLGSTAVEKMQRIDELRSQYGFL